jgi:hypothetical protein
MLIHSLMLNFKNKDTSSEGATSNSPRVDKSIPLISHGTAGDEKVYNVMTSHILLLFHISQRGLKFGKTSRPGVIRLVVKVVHSSQMWWMESAFAL